MQPRLSRRITVTLGAAILLAVGLFSSDAAVASSGPHPGGAHPGGARSATSSASFYGVPDPAASASAPKAPAGDPALVSSSGCLTGRIAVSGIPAGAALFVRAAPNTSAPLATQPAPNGAQFDCITTVPGEPYVVCGLSSNRWMLIPLFGRPPTDVGFAPAACFTDV